MIDGQEVLLIRLGKTVHAITNRCTHLDKSMEGARVMGTQIYCPHHGACFDLVTGKARSGPAVDPLHKWKVDVRDDEIFVQ